MQSCACSENDAANRTAMGKKCNSRNTVVLERLDENESFKCNMKKGAEEIQLSVFAMVIQGASNVLQA